VMKFHAKQSRQPLFTANLRDALIADLADQAAKEGEDASIPALSRCMDKLTESDRRTATLCYVEGLPVRHVADSMGRSPQSVHNSLCRIRKWLLDCIQRDLRASDSPSTIRHNASSREDRS
jgi:RNA polymerase sigma-70 factor (ECF subfamily)